MIYKGDSMAEAKSVVIGQETKIFIKRERIRRELMKIKPFETICLDGEKVETLLKWIKELEERTKRR